MTLSHLILMIIQKHQTPVSQILLVQMFPLLLKRQKRNNARSCCGMILATKPHLLWMLSP